MYTVLKTVFKNPRKCCIYAKISSLLILAFISVQCYYHCSIYLTLLYTYAIVLLLSIFITRYLNYSAYESSYVSRFTRVPKLLVTTAVTYLALLYICKGSSQYLLRSHFPAKISYLSSFTCFPRAKSRLAESQASRAAAGLPCLGRTGV